VDVLIFFLPRTKGTDPMGLGSWDRVRSGIARDLCLRRWLQPEPGSRSRRPENLAIEGKRKAGAGDDYSA
jgi:hypothetical protein